MHLVSDDSTPRNNHAKDLPDEVDGKVHVPSFCTLRLHCVFSTGVLSGYNSRRRSHLAGLVVSFSYISVSATLHIFDTVFVCVVDVAVTEEAWDADKRRCPIPSVCSSHFPYLFAFSSPTPRLSVFPALYPSRLSAKKPIHIDYLCVNTSNRFTMDSRVFSYLSGPFLIACVRCCRPLPASCTRNVAVELPVGSQRAIVRHMS